MTADNHAHLQTMAAVWVQLPDEAHTHTDRGSYSMASYGESIRSVFLCRLTFVCWTVGHGRSVRTLAGQSIFSVVSVLNDEHVRDSFQRTDLKVMRTAAFTNRDTLGQRDGEDHAAS